MSNVPDSRPDWMNDPSIADNQFGVPGVNEQDIASQVAMAMQSLGKRASFDGLGADQGGRTVFDPSNPNAAQHLANTMGVPPTQLAPVPNQPAQTPPAAQPSTEAPEGVDPALWAQWLAQRDDVNPTVDPAATQQTTPPAQDPTTPPAQDPATQQQLPPPDPAANTLRVSIQGQEYEITAEQAEYLLQVNSWLEQQPPEIKDAWSRIQRGEAVAMDRAEYDQIVQAQEAAQRILRFQQQNPTQQQQQLVNEPDLELLDDETANYIRYLKSQVPTADAPPVAPPTQPINPQQQQAPQYDQQEMYRAAQLQAQRDAANRVALEGVVERFREQYDLDEAQVQRLTGAVAQSRMVPVLMQRHAVYSPTGDLISEAPFDRVVNEAFSMAMATDPELSQVHNDYIFNQRLAQEQSANQRVNDKKSRAGSLAAAPSAAVPAGNAGLPPIGPGNQMNLPAMTAAIANAIAEAQSAG